MMNSEETLRPTPATELPEEFTINREIAEHWELWSHIVGATVLPRLEELRSIIPALTTIVLSTSDGLNLCALGVQREEAGRVAAMNSSLFALAATQSSLIDDTGVGTSSTVTISIESGHMVLVSFVAEPLGKLLLGITAQDVPLGALHVHTRDAAKSVKEWLENSNLPL